MITTEPTVWYLPRETKEWIGPITVTANGVAVTTWSAALLPDGVRPIETDWKVPVTVGTGKGVMVGAGTDYPSLTPGTYKVWVRFDNATERPVIEDFIRVVIK